MSSAARVRRVLFGYTEGYHNRRRMHPALGNSPPNMQCPVCLEMAESLPDAGRFKARKDLLAVTIDNIRPVLSISLQFLS